MAKDAEELKIILDMAANGGKMQAQNEMLPTSEVRNRLVALYL